MAVAQHRHQGTAVSTTLKAFPAFHFQAQAADRGCGWCQRESPRARARGASSTQRRLNALDRWRRARSQAGVDAARDVLRYRARLQLRSSPTLMNRSARTFAVVALSLMSAVIEGASCSGRPQTAPSYLFLWAGDAEGKASDFLAVIDAAPASPRYGSIVASIPTGTAGTHPHHTELEMPANGHLLANGFRAGRTWLFDLTEPTRPKVITSFGGLAGLQPSAHLHPSGEWQPADDVSIRSQERRAYGAARALAWHSSRRGTH